MVYCRCCHLLASPTKYGVVPVLIHHEHQEAPVLE
ncbi:hypothetical protein EVA_05927 [gut metagenome]|uniref:Uncharacterized protein n=1 Tax=gut metagenome TaxID=749906 RepID=J9GYM6_9ZZZZ